MAAAAGLIPTLEESIENRTWVVGTPEEGAGGIEEYRRELGGLADLCLFPNFPGDPYAKTEEQLIRYAGYPQRDGSVLGDPPPVENWEADTVTFHPLSRLPRASVTAHGLS